MKMFSIAYLALFIAFADVLFPYSAVALALWVVVAVGILTIQEKLSEQSACRLDIDQNLSPGSLYLPYKKLV